MKGHMAAYCRRSCLPHDLRRPQEVSSNPKKLHPPYKLRRSKTGKSKLAELKDQDEPKEVTKGDADSLTLSTVEVAHYIHDRKEDMWFPKKMTPLDDPVVLGPKHTALLGVKETEYLPAKMTIQVADNRIIRTLSRATINITTVGTSRTTCQPAYIMTGNQLYLSCLQDNYPEEEVTNEKDNLGPVTNGEEERPYNCPNRVLPPAQDCRDPSLAEQQASL